MTPTGDGARLQAMHLRRRLPAGSFAQAAFAGLQDTAPRSATLSLHARMHGVHASSWEHESLVQVFGPRSAVWLVPADAFAAFTLGRMPRDPDAQRVAQRIADEALAGAADPYRRAGAVTGRFRVRWDTRTTELVEVPPLAVDVEDARRDLAARFLAWFGEPMRQAFARWAGVSLADAEETLHHVPARQSPGAIDEADADAAADTDAEPDADRVRFLPQYDPYMYAGAPPPALAGRLAGALLVDGDVRGAWARRGHKVAVRLASPTDEEAVAEAAAALEGPIGHAIALTFER